MKKSSNLLDFRPGEEPLDDLRSLTASGSFLDDLYQRWKTDPATLSPEWSGFFQGFEFGIDTAPGAVQEETECQAKVASLIASYRNQGHLIAQIDPLGSHPAEHPSLDLGVFGLSRKDLTRPVATGTLAGVGRATVAEILEILRQTYCRTIGVEYRHIQDAEVRHWLEAQMEPVRNTPDFARFKKIEILRLLIDAAVFENFLHTRYPGQKRFSLEGAESLIPGLHFLIELAPELGIDNIVFGMAHRGRLNVLANILDKPYALIFSEFEDSRPAVVGGDGDVKYHLGYSSRRRTRSGHLVHLSLCANPSHLEAVNPVVEGRVRARQRRLQDTSTRKRVLPLLIHGDAAFAGQGLVAETLNLSQLAGYRTGGTVHFVINNQIGFTTSPEEARSSCYPTDVVKMIEAPVFHVNGDDPEAVVYVVELALRFRQSFGRDVVVDLTCYRRHGHNEGDEPGFTHPLLYQKIKDRPAVRDLYTRTLVKRGDLSQRQAEKIANGFKARLDKAMESANDGPAPRQESQQESYWSGLDNDYSHERVQTAVAHEALIQVVNALTTIPPGFNLNPKVARRLPEARQHVEEQGSVDWALGELLAFGTLLQEGLPVRLSGQDSERGTFSQRHAVWTDMKSQQEYVPLNHIAAEQGRFCVYNSMLSEAAVLGFDYGYSISEPHMLVLWEAQFGDFANGAQVIIDQFLVSSRAKWGQSSGLVLLLPHGYEGQGPEHSNAYLERYLAASAENNIQVCNLTTPAQYFHALRRQLKRDFRRPLILMSPKSLLRHPLAVSPVAEMVAGGFREIIDDEPGRAGIKRLILCSGKIYYELASGRAEQRLHDVGLVRIEQLYPLDPKQMQELSERYAEADSIVWAQEEPANRGGWPYIYPKLVRFFGPDRLRYAGRRASASPATGSLRAHKAEQARLVDAALGVLANGDRPVPLQEEEGDA